MMMNIMNSGMGTKLAAYAMNPDLSINQNKLDRALSGNLSGYEIASGADSAGFAMGDNRVRIGMAKRALINNLAENPDQMAAATRSLFQAWGSQRPGTSFKNRAAAFAQQFAQNPMQEELLYGFLRGNPGLAQTRGARAASAVGANLATFNDPHEGTISRMADRVYDATAGNLIKAGEGIYGLTSDVMDTFSRTGRSITKRFGRGLERLGMRAGLISEYGAGVGDIGVAQTGLNRFFGAGGPLSKREMLAMSQGVDISSLTGPRLSAQERKNMGEGLGKTFSEMGAKNFRAALERVAIAKGNETVGALREDSAVLRLMGIGKEDATDMTVAGFEESLDKRLQGLGEFRQRMTSADDAYEKYLKSKEGAERDKVMKTLGKVVNLTSTMGGSAEAMRKADTLISHSGLDVKGKEILKNKFESVQSQMVPKFNGVSGAVKESTLIEGFNAAAKKVVTPRPSPTTNKAIMDNPWSRRGAVVQPYTAPDALVGLGKRLNLDNFGAIEMVRAARQGDPSAVNQIASLGEDTYDSFMMLTDDAFRSKYGGMLDAADALIGGRAVNKVRRRIQRKLDRYSNFVG